MITIYLRVVELGLNSTDRQLLSKAGDLVSRNFIEKNLHGRVVVDQAEPDKVHRVWAYPDQYAPEIDKVLISLTKPKRPRLNMKKVNG